jgi:hypothetical protein
VINGPIAVAFRLPLVRAANGPDLSVGWLTVLR